MNIEELIAELGYDYETLTAWAEQADDITHDVWADEPGGELTEAGEDALRAQVKALALSDYTRKSIEAELRYCEQVQSWAPGSTRSQWTHELRAILDAPTEAKATEAMVKAEREARRLAVIVAERLATDEYALRQAIANHLDTEDDAVYDELDSTETVAEMVAFARRHGVTIDDESRGERDGWYINAKNAWAYASLRSLTPSTYDSVTAALEVEA